MHRIVGITFSPVIRKFSTEDSAAKRMKLRRFEHVKKNIASVGEICDKGTFTIFTKDGGAIVKDPDGSIGEWIMKNARNPTFFERTGNVYTMPMWIQIPEQPRAVDIPPRTESPNVPTTATKKPPDKSNQPGNWEKRDSRGRKRPVKESADGMDLDVVLTSDEYRRLVERANARSAQSVFTRLGRL